MTRRRLILGLLIAAAISAATAAWQAGLDVGARTERATLGPYWVLAFPVDEPAEAAAGFNRLERELAALKLAPAALYVRPLLKGHEAGALLNDGDALAVGKLVRKGEYDFKRLYFTGAIVTLPNRGALSRYMADRRAVRALAPARETAGEPLFALARIISPDRLTYALASTAAPGELIP